MRGLEFEVGDRVRITKVTWAYEKGLIGREGVVVEVLPGLLQNGFRVDVRGYLNVYAPHRIELVRKAQDGDHVKLPSGATMIVGAAPKTGERLTPERMSATLRSLSGVDAELAEKSRWLRATASSYFAAKRALGAAYERIEGLEEGNRRLRAENERIKHGCASELFDATNELAPALGYEHDETGWVVGDHTTVTLAMEARSKIAELSERVDSYERILAEIRDTHPDYWGKETAGNLGRKAGAALSGGEGG